MNLSSPTQALQAKSQPGGFTPALIRLLAQMKVKQETDAAARDMAMKMGQQPPTVAEGLNEELEGNARQQITQKLGGLQAIAQQQAPQGAPTMPAPPAQPTQHMAAGGLARVRSNLPTHYAGGGIVAFDDGGGVDGTEWTTRRPHETNADYALRMEAGPNYNKVNPESFGADIAGLVGRGKDAVLAWMRQRDATLNQARMQPADNSGREQFRTMPTSPEAAQPEAPLVNAPASVQPDRATSRANVPASGKKTGVAAIPQNVVPIAAPVSGLQADYETNARKDINADPAMAGLIERMASKERRQAELGGDEAALRAARQQDYEQAKAAHEARMAKSAPSIWDRMGTLGRNAGYGQWGKAAGDQRTMELEHEARGASGLEALLKRKGEVDAMSLADKKAAFDYAEGRGTAAQTAVADSRKGALTSAGQLVATQGTNATTLAATKMQGENQYRVALLQAASHASDLAQRRIDSMDSKTAQIYARSHDIAMKQATDASNKFAESLVGGVTRPGETPESVFTKVYNQAMMTVPGYVPIKNAVADSGMSTKMAEVAAELARRKGGK
jgi:hypothetical protein